MSNYLFYFLLRKLKAHFPLQQGRKRKKKNLSLNPSLSLSTSSSLLIPTFSFLFFSFLSEFPPLIGLLLNPIILFHFHHSLPFPSLLSSFSIFLCCFTLLISVSLLELKQNISFLQKYTSRAKFSSFSRFFIRKLVGFLRERIWA